MKRRSFLEIVLAVAASAGLGGCGSSSADVVAPVTTGGGTAAPGQSVTGRIADELLFAGAKVESAYGPSTVSGSTFTTNVSARTTGLLVLIDNEAGVRGFSLTLPGESPVFSAESTAIAVVFMEPGYLRLNPLEALEQIARIRASASFAPFVALLKQNAATALDFLSGEPTFITARDALVESLSSPIPNPQSVTVSIQKYTATLTNPSPRVLRVVRKDDRGEVTLPNFVPPNGILIDTVVGAATYTFHGLGRADSLPADTFLVESTFAPTLFLNVVIPLLELAAAQSIPAEAGLALFQQLYITRSAPSINARVDLANPFSLARALSPGATVTLGDMAESITQNVADIARLITAGAYVAGLIVSVSAILKFKQHKDNPTQIPVGSPVALIAIAAALLFLPSIIGVAGNTIVGDTGGPPHPP